MRTAIVAGFLLSLSVLGACHSGRSADTRQPLQWSGWIEDAAVRRGHIKAGDFAQFGCPPGWMGVEDTAAAFRGREVSTTYVGTEPPPREGTLTCVAQRDFTLPSTHTSAAPQRHPLRRPLAPVWLKMEADRTIIGFRQELPRDAAIFVGQDTPCGPRLIGVRLGDLLKWLSDPQTATPRDFLGLVSAGCPNQSQR